MRKITSTSPNGRRPVAPCQVSSHMIMRRSAGCLLHRRSPSRSTRTPRSTRPSTAFLDKAKREAEPFRKKGWDTYYYTFYSPVPKGHYLDYNVYVPVDREIYLQTIRGKGGQV